MSCSDQQKFDVSTATCVETLTHLFNAYTAVITGVKPVEVRFDERWISYGRGNVDRLLQAYRFLYMQCPQARAAGLPDLNPGAQAVRVGPYYR